MTARSIVVVTVPAPRAPLEAFLALPLEGERTVWDETGLNRSERWAFAGRGATARLEGAGPERLAQVQRGAEDLFSSLEEIEPTDIVPSPRVFGGVAFTPGSCRERPWDGFPDASFVLPRWLYGTSANASFLRLTIPAAEWVQHQDQLRGDLQTLARMLARDRKGRTAPSTRVGAIEEMPRPDWALLIQNALRSIRADEFRKVVPARRSVVSLEEQPDIAEILRHLHQAEPDCNLFAVERSDAIFFGATPERLISRRGMQVEVDALAGSSPRRSDPDARALLESEKDRREHALVVEGVRAVLEPLSRSLDVPPSPSVRTLRTLHHLCTPVVAELDIPRHVLELVESLHPTAAVCGLPREPARAWIAAHEPCPRGWYSSPVGWFDASGDGSFAVAIRSALVRERQAWLFAGAGVVEGSDPELEYRETGVKQATMLDALGVTR